MGFELVWLFASSSNLENEIQFSQSNTEVMLVPSCTLHILVILLHLFYTLIQAL